MRLAPPLAACCTVRNPAEAALALSAGRPVTLLSVPGFAAAGGAAAWRALVSLVRARHADACFVDLLDCGDAAGRALEALRLGQRRLVFDGDRPLAEALVARAALHGARLWTARPPSLDLFPLVAGGGGAWAAARVASWLARPPVAEAAGGGADPDTPSAS